MSTRKNCLILGSGRSGTSMLGGCLHGAGYFMGEKLYKPSPENPKGYFESRSVESINETILKHTLYGPGAPILDRLFKKKLERGHYWLAELPLGRRVTAPPDAADAIKQLTSRQPYAFKDPRFSYTLPVWKPLLDDVAFVVVFREPGRTVQSILTNCRNAAYLKNFEISPERAFRIWEFIYGHILMNHGKGGDWLFFHYDQILDGSGLSKLGRFLGAELSADFPDPSLKRSLNTAEMPTSVKSIYGQLCDLAGYNGVA